MSSTQIKNCRGCLNLLPPPFLDLGVTPLANSYVKDLAEKEEYFPLDVSFCPRCFLVQITHHIEPNTMFRDYAYFSSYSTSFLEHAKRYVNDLYLEGLLHGSVMEIASNDGYLLQYVEPSIAKILGIEPAINIAKVANEKGIPTIAEFFGTNLVPRILEEFGKSKVIVGNNVLAHVPDINDFIQAVSMCLDPYGAAVFEFPYLYRLIRNMEFDTIYHEHVFYYSVLSLKNLFERHGLEIFNIKFAPIHGGSIRIYTQHRGVRVINSIVSYYELQEYLEEVDRQEFYDGFASKVNNLKTDLVRLLEDLKWKGKTIAAYGAPAKGNTLLNFCGIGKDLIDFTVDISPHKQGSFLPGTHIPIYSREHLLEKQPDYTLLLPWNFSDEIMSQQKEYLKRGGQFIIPVPYPRVVR